VRRSVQIDSAAGGESVGGRQTGQGRHTRRGARGWFDEDPEDPESPSKLFLRQAAQPVHQPRRSGGLRCRGASGHSQWRHEFCDSRRIARRRHPPVAWHRDSRRRDDQNRRSQFHDSVQTNPNVHHVRGQSTCRYHPGVRRGKGHD